MDQDTEHRWCQYCMAKTNKFSFFFQKWQHTSVKDSTNALFVEKKVGCKEEDHQLKVFIEIFPIKIKF